MRLYMPTTFSGAILKGGRGVVPLRGLRTSLLGSRLILMQNFAGRDSAAGKLRRIDLVPDASRAHASDNGDTEVLNVSSSDVFSPVAQALGSGARGTVDASVAPAELRYFGIETTAMATGGPLDRVAAARTPVEPARSRANDLVAELREIGGQVSRMMAQVERAIDRLAIHAG